ncbi:5-(carboxyamino)imidazole ribonucleotide synthase [Scopulibacillus cellulosilyticus]|uniref:N5-carboxyaminoimidazole ribonucleotide synthase n=1 Tax=Scopulibacillus cellulosilyticus TaxID=2665665 RepID=A0ABW2PYY1_9BACL
MINRVLPGETIGILGGGQLGRMMAIAAKEMGFHTAVLDPADNNPCAQVSDQSIVAPYDDLEAAKKLAEASDVITYEFENIDLGTVNVLEKNAYLPQGHKLLDLTKDRINEKDMLTRSGLQAAPYKAVNLIEDLEEAVNRIGLPGVLKTCQGGYDGKGQYVIKNNDDLEQVKDVVDGKTRFIYEKWLDFDKEISVIVTRSTTGEIAVFPVAENIHVNNILHHTIVPARVSEQVEKEATGMAVTLAEKMSLVGTLAVEMFLTKDQKIYANECAPRPHNSGHFTINACETSQFQQHIRAVCGWPLGKTTLLKPVVMVNILGQHLEPVLKRIDQFQDVHLHLYGKEEAKTNRKMGHLTILGENIEEALQKAAALGIWPNLKQSEATV